MNKKNNNNLSENKKFINFKLFFFFIFLRINLKLVLITVIK
jgi:hypothetical protein